MPAALIVLAVIFGICIFGTALLNMGVGGIVLCILVAIACICDKVAEKRRERIEEFHQGEWRSLIRMEILNPDHKK